MTMMLRLTLPETNSSPLKIDSAPWKFGDSYWKPSIFRGYAGELLVSGRVYKNDE